MTNEELLAFNQQYIIARQKRFNDIVTIAVVGLLMLVVGVSVFGSKTLFNERSDIKYDYRGAWNIVKDNVRQQLLAPTDADFPWFDEDVNIVQKNGNECGVIGYVDAKNLFGVRLRYKFAAFVYYSQPARGWIVKECRLIE